MDIAQVAITELEKIDADRIDGVDRPANGIPILLLKSIGDGEAVKDWAQWDADHGGGKNTAAGNTAASAAAAVARAKQTIADHKAGKKVSAKDLKNAHDVHEAHLEHEAKLKAEAEAKAKASKKSVAKGQRDCPDCDKSYDADHQGSTCENCGARLPDADDAAKSLPDWHADAVALVKKAMVRGKVDESQDIDGGQQAIALLGKLIGYEAAELAAGNLGEVSDIGLLADAASLLRAWVSGESAVQDGNVMPATALMQSEAVKAKHSADDRKKLAEQGNALSDGSYPIADEEDLKSAAILAQSGHGDVDGAKRLIGRRSKELGVKNPLDSDTSKSAVAEGETTVDTETQETGGQIAKAVEDAVTKAVAPLQERIASLGEELAKVKAQPIPGGPMMSAAPRQKAQDGENWAAKAVYYRQMADSVSQDPAAADGYRQLARQAEDKAKQTD